MIKRGLPVLFVTAFLLLLSCKKHHVCDEVLTLDKKAYTGDKFKTQGYYYNRIDSKSFKVVILYSNGILVFKNIGNVDNPSALDDVLQSVTLNKSLQRVRRGWGLYDVISDSIKLQYWAFSTCGDLVVNQTGLITNDSTFIFKGSADTMSFRYLSPKPDSTNAFIE